MRIVLRIPPGVAERVVRERLEQEAASLCVDLTIGDPGGSPRNR